MNPTPAPYIFHAFEFSYFSAKVRPALRYKGLWVDERRADFGEILRRTGLGFIPILVTPEDETWQDSTDIYDRLEARHPEPPLFPTTPVQRLAAHLVELYADEFALIPAMHTRWGTPLGEATTRARFGAAMGNPEMAGSGADRMVAARAALGSTPETGPAVEAHLCELLDALSSHITAHPYLLGERMSFADCALMGPFDGHFWSDLDSRKLLLETAPRAVQWIEWCKFPNSDSQGEWLPNDELAPTFKELLGVMGCDAAPVILDSVCCVEDWADQHAKAGDELPRAAGRCDTTLRGTPMPRAAIAYVLYSVQRVHDAYAALDEASRRRVDEALAGTGWEPVLAYTPRHRLARNGFKLVFEQSGGAS